MSETKEAPDAAADLPPGLKVEARTVTVDGAPQDRLGVTWAGRSADVWPLTLGQQFDLAEVTGTQPGNVTWANMALVAASVATLDGMPFPQVAWSKARLRTTLDKLGMDGFRAVAAALGGFRGEVPDEEQHRAVVGN